MGRKGREISMHVIVPPNTTATVYIPAERYNSITEKENPIPEVKGLEKVSMDDSHAVVKLGSGDHTFESIIP